jgi:phosphatidate cytidylyltransferase
LGALILVGTGWVDAEHIIAARILVLVALGLLAVAILTSERRAWAMIGLGYALAASIASSAVRLDPVSGFAALMLVLLVVWATDIGGYFAGRLIGGPKLWPQVSPKKTWAGAIGGFAASLGVAAGFAAFDFGRTVPMLLLSAGLSVASQLGDLFESAVKRRFGVKDSSHIIPGHGGLMDRLDGFVAAIVVAALFGFLRGGADGVGRGLMVW